MRSHKSPTPSAVPRPRASVPRSLTLSAVLTLLLALAAVPLTSGSAQAAPSGAKDVVANLFAWNWPSVSAECTNVLGPAGYGGVQVSPPQDSLKRPGTHSWWELYQPAAYDLTGRLGSRAQFSSMVQACHAAGVKVYADAVINHMTGQGSTSYGGKTFSKYVYTGTYSAADFHYYPAACGNSDNTIHDGDYTGSANNVQRCELVGLADLDTGASYVRSRIAAYLNDLTGLGVDGFRVDAAKHMSPADLSAIYGRLSGSPYIFQEVIYGGGEAVQPSQYTGLGDVLDFQYGRYLKQKFEGNISDLQTFGASWGGMQASDKAVTFVTNHDTERNGSTLTYKSGSTYTLANIFQLAWNHGAPQIYDGFTFSDNDASPPSDGNGYVTAANCSSWTCLHRDSAINGMVGFHNAVKGTSVANWSAPNSSVIAFSRGSTGWVAINNGSGSHSGTFTTGLPAGTYANLTGGGSVTVGSSGTASVTVPAKAAVAIRVGGTGSTPTPTPTSSSIATSFNANVTTTWGQNVFVVGNVAELGGWNPANSIALSSATYPIWRATVNLPANTAIQYKYIKKNTDGSVTWESDPNRSFTTPSGGTATRDDTWR
ncbi:carbohydrate-binding module family 20 domain-containing protein [Sphaerisporangium perillae]|uniref:carbohydrate-binding module family 20 domain-containing protein n=1 Tax=Sphaerisporangium perillae TaxID=2935860 RepID=UPI00200CEAD8|nr:carbohydrate-binding module family 20 domain-containing protein [Sphaerisporangium perillae]